MNSDRIAFIKALFRYLSNIEYCWLKAILARPEDTPLESDIDIFIQAKDLASVLLFIAKQPLVKCCELAQKGEATFLQITFNDGSDLKLDLLTALVRKQFCYLPAAPLLANKVWRDGVATYPPEVLLEHALLFNFLNHAGLPMKYIRHFGAMPSSEQAKLLAYINGKYGTQFTSIKQMAHFSVSGQNDMVDYLKRHLENGFTARSQRYLRHLSNQFLGYQNQAPSIITFTGVDGAGKTTLLNDLRSVLSEKLNKKVAVLRHRPSLLPILSAYTHGKQAAHAKAATTLPRQGSNNSTFSSLLRFGYYYTDFILGQIYVWLRYTLPGYTLIYDRYYFDFIVDGKRSNISLGEALPKWLYRFVTKPGLNLFLYAAPEIIRQRKQELPTEDIERMTGQYRALFEELSSQYKGQYLSIENHDRQATLDTILTHYLFGANGDASPINHGPEIRNPKSEIRKPMSPIPC